MVLENDIFLFEKFLSNFITILFLHISLFSFCFKYDTMRFVIIICNKEEKINYQIFYSTEYEQNFNLTVFFQLKVTIYHYHCFIIHFHA